jgi:hypothetical protein
MLKSASSLISYDNVIITIEYNLTSRELIWIHATTIHCWVRHRKELRSKLEDLSIGFSPVREGTEHASGCLLLSITVP